MSSGSKKRTQICYPFPSKSPGKRIPYRFPNGAPMDINTPLQEIFTSKYISFYLTLRIPVKGAPPPSVFPNRVSMGSDTSSPAPLVYFIFIHSFMYVCRSPQKGALLRTYGEKHKVTVHGAPRRRNPYIQRGAVWFPPRGCNG
jgi:hypothetical protein